MAVTLNEKQTFSEQDTNDQRVLFTVCYWDSRKAKFEYFKHRFLGQLSVEKQSDYFGCRSHDVFDRYFAAGDSGSQ